MKLYQLNKVKQKIIQNSGIKNNSLQEFKNSLLHNYHIDILEKLSIDNIYMITDHFDFNIYLNEEQIEKVNLMAKLNTGLNLNFYEIPYIETENFVNFKFNSKKDIPEINKNYKNLDSIKNTQSVLEEKQRKLLNKERADKFGHIKESLKGQRIVSIDFEFNPNSITEKYNLDFISEIGVTTNFKNAIQSKHFIVEENKKDTLKELNFLYGKSQMIKINEIKEIINSEIKNADILVVHSYNTELNFLVDNNINYDHLNIVDVQLLYKHYFDNNDENLKKLSKILIDFDINYAFLHNAGNDAYYTYAALDKMLNKINNKKINSLKI